MDTHRETASSGDAKVSKSTPREGIKWVSPREKANLDHTALRDRIRKDNSSYESGRHDE